MTVQLKAGQLKKNQQTAEKTQEVLLKKSLVATLGDMKAEFGKITWTSREELVTYTKIVVGATFVLGMGIYLIDIGIQAVLAALGGIVRALIG